MFTIDVQASNAFATFDGLVDKVRERFIASVREIEERILEEARRNTVAHFHSVGKKPGLYLAGFAGGVKVTDSAVVGWVRNSNQLAHLFEYGFTISEFLIQAKGANGVLAFELPGAAEVFARNVRRPETKVQAYPAIRPAFDAHKGELEAAARKAIEDL